jgi:hypothetical protein
MLSPILADPSNPHTKGKGAKEAIRRPLTAQPFYLLIIADRWKTRLSLHTTGIIEISDRYFLFRLCTRCNRV